LIYSPSNSNLVGPDGRAFALSEGQVAVCVGAALAVLTTPQLPAGAKALFPPSKHGVSAVTGQRLSLVYRFRGRGSLVMDPRPFLPAPMTLAAYYAAFEEAHRSVNAAAETNAASSASASASSRSLTVFDGQRLRDEDSAYSLQMEDNDQIEVSTEVLGD